MGINDRDYIRTRRRGQFAGPSSPAHWPFNTWIIAINVAVFLLGYILTATGAVVDVNIGGPGHGQVVRMSLDQALGHFSTAKAFFYQASNGQTVFGLEFWRFITFQFLHANWLHLFFNMLALWIFGPLVEARMGFKRYAAFYLVCGVFGAIMYLALNLTATLIGPGAHIPGLLFNDPRTPLVGASAGVFGVLMAAAYFRPNDRVVLLFPPIPLRLKTLAYGYVAIAVFTILFGGHNAGGQAAHIGGAIAGFFFVRNSHLLYDFFDILGKSPPPPDSPKAKARRAKGERLRSAAHTGRRGARSDAPTDAEVDRILSKVATEGLQSLSPAEKRTLERASQDKRGG